MLIRLAFIAAVVFAACGSAPHPGLDPRAAPPNETPDAAVPARSFPDSSTPTGALHTIVYAIEHDDAALLRTVLWSDGATETRVDEFLDKDRDEILECLRGVRVTHTEPHPDYTGHVRVTIEGCSSKTSGRMIQEGGNWKLVKF